MLVGLIRVYMIKVWEHVLYWTDRPAKARSFIFFDFAPSSESRPPPVLYALSNAFLIRTHYECNSCIAKRLNDHCKKRINLSFSNFRKKNFYTTNLVFVLLTRLFIWHDLIFFDFYYWKPSKLFHVREKNGKNAFATPPQ